MRVKLSVRQCVQSMRGQAAHPKYPEAAVEKALAWYLPLVHI
jgi:hypothetical protein